MHEPISQDRSVDDVPQPLKVCEDVVDDTRTGSQNAIDS